jgi:hypothetical protein
MQKQYVYEVKSNEAGFVKSGVAPSVEEAKRLNQELLVELETTFGAMPKDTTFYLNQKS